MLMDLDEGVVPSHDLKSNTVSSSYSASVIIAGVSCRASACVTLHLSTRVLVLPRKSSVVA